MDLIKITHDYSRSLMELQKDIWIRKKDLNVFESETIPAIQYCSVNYLVSVMEFYKIFIPTLDIESTYLNIGSGANFLEHGARQAGFLIKCADIVQTNPIFDPLRRSIGVPLDFEAGLYSNQMNIAGCGERYDYLMFIRYIPWEHNFDPVMFTSFMKSGRKYSDKAIIQLVKGSYNEIRQFFKENNHIIESRYDVGNTDNYTIDLNKLGE